MTLLVESGVAYCLLWVSVPSDLILLGPHSSSLEYHWQALVLSSNASWITSSPGLSAWSNIMLYFTEGCIVALVVRLVPSPHITPVYSVFTMRNVFCCRAYTRRSSSSSSRSTSPSPSRDPPLPPSPPHLQGRKTAPQRNARTRARTRSAISRCAYLPTRRAHDVDRVLQHVGQRYDRDQRVPGPWTNFVSDLRLYGLGGLDVTRNWGHRVCSG